MASIINGGTFSSYYVTPTGVTISGRIKSYDTIADRNNDTNPPEYAIVADATADPTVKTGSAVYVYSNNSWTKVYEVESMDLDEYFVWDNIIGKPDITKEEYDAFVEQINQLSKIDVSGDTLVYNGEKVFDAARDITVTGSGLTATYHTDNTVSIHSDRTIQGLDTINGTIYTTSIDFMQAVDARGFVVNSVVMGVIRTSDLPFSKSNTTTRVSKANIYISITEEDSVTKYNAFIQSVDLDGLYVATYDSAVTDIEWTPVTENSSNNITWVVL